MITNAQIDTLDHTLRNHGELHISMGMALEIFAQARREIAFHDALVAIAAGKPSDPRVTASKALQSVHQPKGVLVSAGLG